LRIGVRSRKSEGRGMKYEVSIYSGKEIRMEEQQLAIPTLHQVK